MSKYVLAIDQGTTSSRCVVFAQGKVAGVGQKEHKQIYPRAGWVEHDPMEIWGNVVKVIEEAMGKAGAKEGEIGAIGITNQRETTVVWDKRTGMPVYNAIVWQDVRTASRCEELIKQGKGEQIRQRTGVPVATYFSATKLEWLLRNVEGLRTQAEAGNVMFGTMDSWIIYNLTGGRRGGRYVTDVTNASRTMLMDLEKLAWDEGLLAEFGVPAGMMPGIVSSSDAEGFGKTVATGPVGEEVRITGVLGDQHAALVGQGCLAERASKNTYGTGCFMLVNTGQKIVRSKHGLITTVAYRFGAEKAVYALEGSVAVAGAGVQWLRDNLGLIQTSAEVEALANSVEDNGGVYFVPAFSGLFAPYWKSDARGVIVGLTGHSHRGHFAKAALEAVAYQTLDVFEAMEKDGGHMGDVLRVDGGMTVNDGLMQFQADMLGRTVERPAFVETTVMGAAEAAARGAGMEGWCDKLREAGKRWEPGMEEGVREGLKRKWRMAVERAMGWEG